MKPMTKERRAEIEADVERMRLDMETWHQAGMPEASAVDVELSECALFFLREALDDAAFWREKYAATDPTDGEGECRECDKLDSHTPDCAWLLAQEGK